MSFHELIGDYPWLTKRMASVQALAKNQKPKHPRRSFFAWIFAVFVPRLGVGGGSQSIIIFVAIIGILAAIAIPAYQDYTNRAALSAAYQMSEPVQQDVVEYATRTNTWPGSNADLGITPIQGDPTVSDIRVGEGGVITITFAKRNLQGKSLILEPSVSQGRVVWHCRGIGFRQKIMPRECR